MLNRSGRILRFILIQLFLCLFILEGGSRLVWKLKAGVPIFQPSDVKYHYYPELRGGETSSRQLKDPLNILVLGGSAMHSEWGSVVIAIKEELMRKLQRDVIIRSLATPGHTTLDSLWKIQEIDDSRYDAVVLYHGINDARANNCPPAVFDPLYQHYTWYKEINALRDTFAKSSYFMFPFTLKVALIRMEAKLNPDRFISQHEPRRDWLQYGVDVKTKKSFETNVSEICTIAASNNASVFLGSFASSVPVDYSRSGFEQRSLDYAVHETFIEMWGSTEGVVAALKTHNASIYKVAQESQSAHFVDIAKGITGGKQNFNDICHFTVAGSDIAGRVWAKALIEELAEN